MKKLLVFALMTLTTLLASAQKGNFTIALGTTTNPMARALKVNDLTVQQSSLPLHAEIGYFVSNKLQFSLAFNTSSASSSDKIMIGTDELQVDFKNAKATSFMVRTNFFYVNTKRFQLGSGLALGMVNTKSDAEVKWTSGGSTDAIKIDDPGKNGFAIHLNLLEARYYFTEHIGMYGSFGFQDQGLAGIGIIGQF